MRRTEAQLLRRVHSCKAPQPLAPTSTPWARCSPAPKIEQHLSFPFPYHKVCKTFPTIYYSLSGLSVLNASCSLRLESTALSIQPAKPYPLFKQWLKNSILCEAFFIPPTFSAPISGGSNTWLSQLPGNNDSQIHLLVFGILILFYKSICWAPHTPASIRHWDTSWPGINNGPKLSSTVI